MTIKYVTGDLLKTDLPAIAHGCNARGVMGSGIAKKIKDNHPRMFTEYEQRCKKGQLLLGDIFPWSENNHLKIYNLITQVEPGPNADPVAIAVSVVNMAVNALFHFPTIGIPRIGAGIGGLKWPVVEHALEVATVSSGLNLVVYTLPSEVEKYG